MDWKGALENIKGVYVIFDDSNGRKYVGAAYSTSGIWARWSVYAGTGHGWSDELTKKIASKGIGYARRHLRFTLIEYFSMKTDDNIVVQREAFWKEA